MFPVKAFSFLEVLISLVILSFALLSLIKLQMVSLDYQYEATLITRANHILTDATLATLFGDAKETEANQVQAQFPQGQWQASTSDNNINLQLSWQIPKQPPYQLKFNLS